MQTALSRTCLRVPAIRVLPLLRRPPQLLSCRRSAARGKPVCLARSQPVEEEETSYEDEFELPEGPVAGLKWRPENYPDAEQLYPATEDKPMDFADAVSIEDPELRQRALDELLVPLGHQPGSQVVEIPLHGMRKNDYTPYEYLDWTDDEIAHHLNITCVVQVEAPIAKVFEIWADRTNWHEWFDLIGQTVYHHADPNIVSLFMFYRWGQLPTLELYVTLNREEVVKDALIVEKTLEGMPMACAVFFREVEDGTEVNLRIAYCLCAQLREFVGPVGVYGDVNDILKENMEKMKVFIEGVDLEELRMIRKEDNDQMDTHIARKEKEISANLQREYNEMMELQEKEKAAEEAAASRPPPTQPNATASSAVVQGEQSEDAQGMSEYSPGQVPASGISEGYGQEAEASRSKYTTPSGVRQSDPWKSGVGTEPDAQIPGAPEDPWMTQQAESSPQEAESAEEPELKRRQKRTKAQGGEEQPEQTKQGDELVKKDPGGGQETGAGATDLATPAGKVEPQQGGERAKSKTTRRAKAGDEAAAKPAKRRPGRPKKGEEPSRDPWK